MGDIVAPKIGKPKLVAAAQASQQSSASTSTSTTALSKTETSPKQQDHQPKVAFPSQTQADNMAVESQTMPAASSSTQPTAAPSGFKPAVKRRARVRPAAAITAAGKAKRANLIQPPVKTVTPALAVVPIAQPATQDSPTKGLTLADVQARRTKARQDQQQQPVATDQTAIRAAARQAAMALSQVPAPHAAPTAVANSNGSEAVALPSQVSSVVIRSQPLSASDIVSIGLTLHGEPVLIMSCHGPYHVLSRLVSPH